jgi:glycosyltransferase involved in cell wall biosynthesis
VDIGLDGKRRIGATDARGNCHIRTVDYKAVAGFDLFVSHSDMPRAFLDTTEAPVVHVIHGRPLSSFRLSQRDPKAPVYQLLSRWAQDPRYVRFVTLWPEHLPFWDVMIPEEKLVAVEAPCDRDRFTRKGPVHDLRPCGDFNILIADLWRPDGDPYNIAHGMLASTIKGLKVHFYGCNTKPGPWEYIWRAMKRQGILGETKGMMQGFDRVLRSVDLVVTPHRIATRIVRESLSVGTPVVAPLGSRHGQVTYLFSDDPESIGTAVDRMASIMAQRPDDIAGMVEASASRFDLAVFGKAISKVYEEVLDVAERRNVEAGV